MKKSLFVQETLDSLQIVVASGCINAVKNDFNDYNLHMQIGRILNHKRSINLGATLTGEQYKHTIDWLSMVGKPATKENLEKTIEELRTLLTQLWKEMTFPVVVPDGVYPISQIED